MIGMRVVRLPGYPGEVQRTKATAQGLVYMDSMFLWEDKKHKWIWFLDTHTGDVTVRTSLHRGMSGWQQLMEDYPSPEAYFGLDRAD